MKTWFNFVNLSIYQQLLVKNMHILSELLRRKYTEGGYKWLTREYWSHHMIDCVTGKFITNIGETFEIQLIEICNIAHLHSLIKDRRNLFVSEKLKMLCRWKLLIIPPIFKIVSGPLIIGKLDYRSKNGVRNLYVVSTFNEKRKKDWNLGNNYWLRYFLMIMLMFLLKFCQDFESEDIFCWAFNFVQTFKAWVFGNVDFGLNLHHQSYPGISNIACRQKWPFGYDKNDLIDFCLDLFYGRDLFERTELFSLFMCNENLL